MNEGKFKYWGLYVFLGSHALVFIFVNLTSMTRSVRLPAGAKRVQEVDSLRGEKGAKLASETLGSGETSLGDALWCCSNLYSDIKLRLSHKRLMIFTCRDNPHDGDAARSLSARTKAGDLKDTGGYGTRCLGGLGGEERREPSA